MPETAFEFVTFPIVQLWKAYWPVIVALTIFIAPFVIALIVLRVRSRKSQQQMIHSINKRPKAFELYLRRKRK